jgi:DNA topoisomerase-3
MQYVYAVQVSRDCKYLSTTVTFKVGSETFTCVGKTLLDPGYTTIMHWQAFGKNETVPTFAEGEMARIQDVSLVVLEQTVPV